MDDDIILSVRNLKTYYPILGGFFKRTIGQVRAVDGVSFDLKKRETIGLVGESGCGKTTIANTLLKLVDATEGKIIYQGKTIIEANKKRDYKNNIRKEIQMVFQDPDASLNPRWKVVDIIGEPLRLLEGLSKRRKIRKRVWELLKTVSLKREHLDRYPHEFSGGQKQRIVIARALACNPKIIILDEPTSALDVSVQAQILNLLKRLQDEFDLSYLFITHDLSVVHHIADKIKVMYLGKFVEEGTIDDIFTNPSHPYTRALLSARPTFDPAIRKERIILEGDVPSPINPPTGCPFHPRCPSKEEHEGCGVDKPRHIKIEGGSDEHYIFCLPFTEGEKSYEGWQFISD
ncbi:MAG: ATP-binding cassette domain-containing protein [Candidatus Lokiarchaeota archaeon]|nr:ATP-binding cassette domain-containing protein [Candidatus Lokiarchaeota archaeon]MBD3200510.1 ATP-binding cassette domain-containing protein [Candidatus Lokiarchaeota archaeon]